MLKNVSKLLHLLCPKQLKTTPYTGEYLCRLQCERRKCFTIYFQWESISECQSDRFENTFQAHILPSTNDISHLCPHMTEYRIPCTLDRLPNEASIHWSTKHNAYNTQNHFFFVDSRKRIETRKRIFDIVKMIGLDLRLLLIRLSLATVSLYSYIGLHYLFSIVVNIDGSKRTRRDYGACFVGAVVVVVVDIIVIVVFPKGSSVSFSKHILFVFTWLLVFVFSFVCIYCIHIRHSRLRSSSSCAQFGTLFLLFAFHSLTLYYFVI